MQTISLNLNKKTVIPVLCAKQGDVGRKFKAVITDGTDRYQIPAGTIFSIWYSGTSGEGNYTNIGDICAYSIDGDTVTVELITQMLTNAGDGQLCLVMSDTKGNQLGTWNIPYVVEQIPGMGSIAAEQYFTAFSESIQRMQDTFEQSASLGRPGEGDRAIQFNNPTNQAISEDAMAVGCGSIAGGKGFCVLAINPNDSELKSGSVYRLSSGAGLEKGLTYSVRLASVAHDVGVITDVYMTNVYTDIAVTNMPDIALEVPEAGGTFTNYLTIVGRPDLGDVDIGLYAHAEGENTIAHDRAGHVEGRASMVIGQWGHAEGDGTVAGYAAHAEGDKSRAVGSCAHAEGRAAQATGHGAHAEGGRTKATAKDAHSEGFYTEANGEGTHSEGAKTIAAGKYQHVQGRYNVEDPKGEFAHIVGNGCDAKNGAAWTVFDIGGLGCTAFYSAVGITNQLGQDGNSQGVIFAVYGTKNYGMDFELLAQSDIIARTTVGEFNLDITGIKQLKLVVRCAGSSHACCNSAWANACLHTGPIDDARKGYAVVTAFTKPTASYYLSDLKFKDSYYPNNREAFRDKAWNSSLANSLKIGGTSGDGGVNDGVTFEKGLGVSPRDPASGTERRRNAHTVDWWGNAYFAGSVDAAALVLQSPNGTCFRIAVDDNGSLTTTAV